MADPRTLYPPQSGSANDNGDFDASIWALSDGGAATESTPIAGDTVNFTANSGTMNVRTATIAFAAMNLVGGTLTFHQNTAIYGNTLLAGSTLDYGNYDLSFYGDFEVTSGTLSNQGVTYHMASGNVKCPTTSKVADIRLAQGAAVTSTLTNSLYCNRLRRGAGAVAGSAQILYIYGDTDDCYVEESPTGTMTCKLQLIGIDDFTISGGVNASGSTSCTLRPADGKTIIIKGQLKLNATPFAVQCTTAGTGYIEVNPWCFNYQYTKLGHPSGANYFGVMKLHGNCRLGYVQKARDADDSGNKLDWGSSTVLLQGDIDGDSATGGDLLFGCDAGMCHITGGDGTLYNCGDPGGEVYCHDIAGFSGNHANYKHNTHPNRGSLMITGAGY